MRDKTVGRSLRLLAPKDRRKLIYVVFLQILLSGLDILRRVIQLIYSFVWFKEPFDAIIGISLLFLGLSGGLLLYQYVRDYMVKVNLQHLPMVEMDLPAES